MHGRASEGRVDELVTRDPATSDVHDMTVNVSLRERIAAYGGTSSVDDLDREGEPGPQAAEAVAPPRRAAWTQIMTQLKHLEVELAERA
jgi:hypothetical protein